MIAKLEYPFGCNLLVIQPTPFCNLDCSYCYLNDKNNPEKMKVNTLHKVLCQVLNSGIITKETTIVWHAGEPLSTPIKHFRELLNCVQEVDHNKYFHHSIQTNGIIIDDQWCKLFNEYDIDIGISIDGPLKINDSFRVDRKGKGTFDKAIQGLNLLKKHNVKHHIIAVLTEESLERPEEILDFFIKLDVCRLGFNIEEIEGVNSKSSAYKSLININRFFNLAHKIHLDQEINVSIREFIML